MGPFPAGGSTDILGRLMRQRPGPVLGTTIAVDNKTSSPPSKKPKWISGPRSSRPRASSWSHRSLPDSAQRTTRLQDVLEDTRVDAVLVLTSAGAGANIMAFDHQPHREVLRDFVQAVRDDTTPAVNGQSALLVHRLIDDMMTSSRFWANAH